MQTRREQLLAANQPAGTTTAGGSSDPQKNVLLFIADDLGFQVGAYGDQVIETPCLDELCSQGIRFTNTFCTTASCSASRSVIYTGLHNHTNGQFGHTHDFHHFSLHGWVKTLPALLKENGYKTGIVGKTHFAPVSQYPFDVVENSRKLQGNRDVYEMSLAAKEFFESTDDKPFFLTVSYSDPHRAQFGFANDKAYPYANKVTYSPDTIPVPHYLPDSQETREELAEYYQSITRLDHGIGMVLDELEWAGKKDNTLVIVISDNGPPFPGAKTTCYDPGLNLPMIVRSPSQTKRRRVNTAMINFTCITPTILDWTNTKPPEYELHGKSFLPILEEESPSGWDEVEISHTFHEITNYYPVRGIRTRRFKYLHNLAHETIYPFASDLYASPTWQGVLKRGDRKFGSRTVDAYLHRPQEELYDLEHDPHEVNNLASDPVFQETLLELRNKTRAFRTKTKDPWIIGEPGMTPDQLRSG